MSIRFVLTGGIGAGKSLAGKCFESLGARMVRADDLARALLEPGTMQFDEVRAAWPDVVREGRIDRGALGRLVFADPVALEALQAITHPETRQRIMEMADRHPTLPLGVEIPLLTAWFDGWPVVVVDAADQVRAGRAAARDRQRSAADIAAIMRRQPSRSEWLLAADFVIENSGSVEDLQQQCRRVWALLVEADSRSDGPGHNQ